MPEISKAPTSAKIEFVVCLSLQGPIALGDYSVEHAIIKVSYDCGAARASVQPF
jgi:hypothetical protein